MRLIVVLFLSLAVLAALSDPVKSNDKDKAQAYALKKAKLEKEKEEQEVKEETLDEAMQDAGFSLEGDVADDDEKPAPKKKKTNDSSRSSNKKKSESQKKSKKGKKSDKDIPTVSDNASIPNMTSFDLFAMAREHRIDKLREIINDTPLDDLEKLRQITEEVKEESTEDDDDNGMVYQACNYELSGDDELCHCDMDKIDCSQVTMASENPYMTNMNVVIVKKDFEPIIANFSFNMIARLRAKEVLPKFEKYVKHLDLSYNRIRYIDNDAFKPFTNLNKLLLGHNSMMGVIRKEIFEPLKDSLHKLDLGFNRLEHFEHGFFEKLKNLKSLTLDGNFIDFWNKEMFRGLDNLETLSLDNCHIIDLPADLFEYLPKLTGLSIRNNLFEEIPAVIANTKSLKTVDLSRNNLTEIRNHAFRGDSELTEILLDAMPYLSVVRDCAFCELPKLEVLQMSWNKKLVEIHPNAFGFIKSEPGHKAASLKELYIDNSNLSTISEHMLNYDKLNAFTISGNPWNCDCSTTFLMEEKFSFKRDLVSPVCKTPASLSGKHLAIVRASDACDEARFLGRSSRFGTVFGLGLLACFLSCFMIYLYVSGKGINYIRQLRKQPEVVYCNLDSTEEVALQSDFQPRPAEV